MKCQKNLNNEGVLGITEEFGLREELYNFII